MLEGLLEHVQVIYEKSKKIKNKSLEGKTFVFTGSLKNITRTEAQQKVRDCGGLISSTASKKTTYLVAGESSGSKYDKAIALGVKIISEKEFERMI
jgi:DNA ligase (NAD+)